MHARIFSLSPSLLLGVVLIGMVAYLRMRPATR